MAIKKYHVSKNLFYASTTQTVGSVLAITQTANNSDIILNKAASQSDTSANIDLNMSLAAGTYTLSVSGLNDISSTYDRLFLRNANNEIIANNVMNNNPVSFTLTEATTMLKITIVAAPSSIYTNNHIQIMLNTGQTALPYEPYDDSFKDWFYREYGTETETFTTLPKTIIGDGTALSAWSMKGNMAQSGTPTPSNPIYPTECGDKTANLSFKIIRGAAITSAEGKIVTDNDYSLSIAPVEQGTVYSGNGNVFAYFYDEPAIGSVAYNGQRTVANYINRTAPITGYVAVRIGINDTNVMLNEGSTILPYEPYGYKIPISLSSTPIYLSEPIRKISTYADECPSTGTASRPIKKLVLTGQESGWEVFPVGTGRYFRYMISSTVTAVANIGICSHYVQSNIGSATINTDVFTINAPSSGGNGVVISPSDITISTVTDFKQYLADQYSEGTPVTIWYVLATAETESFTAPTLPTSGTAQSFDVSTTLKPSEVSLTWHGWHEHEDTKYTTP